jgi:hypothetical protein
MITGSPVYRQQASMVILLVVLCVVTASVSAETNKIGLQVHTQGNAFDLGSGELLYQEFHFCDRLKITCLVEYRGVEGEIIALKTLDYSRSAHAPTLSLRDFRHALDSVTRAEPARELVVDAGFDNYVRSQWPQIVAGQELTFLFLPGGRNKPIRMSARKVSSGSCNPDTLCIEVSADSWFVGLFLDPIQLHYSQDQRRLLNYRGLGSIRGEDGELLRVDIAYRYSDGDSTDDSLYPIVDLSDRPSFTM